MLDAEQQTLLLAWARAHLETLFGGPAPDEKRLVSLPEEVGGVFVTLESGGDLRGCIGYVLPDLSLIEATGRAAIAAATEDPRFPRVRAEETASLSLSISILETPRKLEDIEAVRIGRHGLLVQDGRARGLLLPQVAAKRGWDPERFVSECCRKAGLPLDAWRRSTAELSYFEAYSFSEEL